MLKAKQQFQVIIEQDGGFFTAYVPALPGCHTQAKTLPQLKKRLQEAIELCLELMVADPLYRKRMKMFAYEPNFVGLQTISV